MDTLQSLFSIATATIFTLTAGLVRTFFWFPFHPYGSVVMTSRLLRTHHITTIALVAFSFLVFALLPAGTGFNGSEALQKIWQTDKRQVEYRVPEIVTRGRFPDGGESDSTWRTQEARHVGSDTIAPGF
jgi:hypothetical protein